MPKNLENKPWLRFWIAFGAGIVIACAVIEIVRGLYISPSPQSAFFEVIAYIGRFHWLYDFQTLLTGLAAVAAATASIKALREQIRSSEASVQKQIDHEREVEADRIDARRASSRAVLPLALAALSRFAEKSGEALKITRDQCVEHALPKNINLPSFPDLPTESIAPLKEMVELSTRAERAFLWNLLNRIQVFQSRVDALRANHLQHGHVIVDLNIDALLLDAAEIYARSSKVLEFARGARDEMPERVSRLEMAEALRGVGITDELYDEIVNRYRLSTDEAWEPRWLR